MPSAAAAKPVGGFLSKGTLPSPRLVHTGGQGASLTADFNDTAVGATTELRVAECLVTAPCWTTGAALFNAGNVTDDARIILYDSRGIIVASTAGVQQTPANTYQRMAWAKEFVTTPGTATTVVGPIFLVPGTYFLGVIHDGTTSTVQTFVVGSFAAKMIAATYATAGITTDLSITPPTDFTTLQGPVIALY